MNKQHQCGSCGSMGMERSIKHVKRKFQGQTLTIPSVDGWHCPNCGEVEFADSEQAWQFFAAAEAIQEKTV